MRITASSALARARDRESPPRPAPPPALIHSSKIALSWLRKRVRLVPRTRSPSTHALVESRRPATWRSPACISSRILATSLLNSSRFHVPAAGGEAERPSPRSRRPPPRAPHDASTSLLLWMGSAARQAGPALPGLASRATGCENATAARSPPPRRGLAREPSYLGAGEAAIRRVVHFHYLKRLPACGLDFFGHGRTSWEAGAPGAAR